MQEDIVQPGYTVGSSFGQASRMINGGLVRDLLFDHQVDVRYFVTDSNGDPAKDANGKRAHKSILFRDDQNRLLCEGTHYPASSIKTAEGSAVSLAENLREYFRRNETHRRLLSSASNIRTM